jgi:acyl-CoA synthetase (AMP-forming)/AMP-acid ligase II
MAAGIEARDRVGIRAPNRYEWVITQFATARIGAILVNINPAYKTAELRYALRQSGVRLLIPRSWKFVDEYPMTVTGKIQKFRMREIAVAELGLEKAASTVTA